MRQRIDLRMPAELRDRLRLVCEDQDMTEGAFICAAVETAVAKAERARRRAKRRDSVDEPLLSHLRVIVAGALVAARGWEDLQARLAERDLGYAAKGGGLGLQRLSNGEDLCKASEIGPGYAQLIRRFQAPFPDHPHAWIAERVLGAVVRRNGAETPWPPRPEDDDPVLEVDA